VAGREVAGHEHRVGLRQHHDRIVELAAVALLELVAAHLGVGEVVDAEDLQAFAALGVVEDQPGVEDERGGGLHSRHRAHALEELLGDARLAVGDREHRAARDVVDRGADRLEDRAVHQPHGDDHRHSEREPEGGERGA
jgi:hypothetical protein